MTPGSAGQRLSPSAGDTDSMLSLLPGVTWFTPPCASFLFSEMGSVTPPSSWGFVNTELVRAWDMCRAAELLRHPGRVLPLSRPTDCVLRTAEQS